MVWRSGRQSKGVVIHLHRVHIMHNAKATRLNSRTKSVGFYPPNSNSKVKALVVISFDKL